LPVIQRQSADPAKSIYFANVSAAGTLMMLIKICQQRSHFIEDTVEPSAVYPGLSP